MATQTHFNETWVKKEDGTMELVSSEEVQVEVQTVEEIIADKEAQLIKIYEEIQSLKAE